LDGVDIGRVVYVGIVEAIPGAFQVKQKPIEYCAGVMGRINQFHCAGPSLITLESVCATPRN
jgi:hypothetical protein